MKKIHTLILLLCCLQAHTQNLVPNASFENNMPAPYISVVPTLDCLADWKDYSGTLNPAFNTPDLCYNTSVFFPLVSIPAYDGTQYMGIDCQLINPEYIQIRLTTPMESGQTYCVSFYVSMYNEFNTPVKVGAFFSDEALTLNPLTEGLHSQIDNTVVPDPGRWQQVSDVYTATGGEEFMVIGGFENTANAFAYMYVDLVEVYGFEPVLDLGPDTSFCKGSSLVLDAGPGGSAYRWSNGENTAAITVDVPGKYRVEKFYGACSTTDSIVVEIKQLDLGPDRLLCEGEELVISAGETGTDTYRWSNGETTASITVTGPGIYQLEKQAGNCFLYDAVQVNVTDCSVPEETGAEVYVPNAFTPDHDGINDFFAAQTTYTGTYNMTIFNRWGEIIFTAENASTGWDGTYQNREAPTDVYVYSITYYRGIIPVNIKGHVALLR